MGQHEDQIRQLVLTMYDEVWNKGNMAAADDAVSSDFDDHPPTRFFDVGRTGPGALTEAAGSFRNAIPDFHDTPELVLVEGDRAAYLGAISGKQTGEMFGFPPQGRRMRVWGINIFALNDDGLISERWGQFDVLTMMQQLGVAPARRCPRRRRKRPSTATRVAPPTTRRTPKRTRTSTARMVEEVVNKGNFDVIPELFHEDYVDHASPPGTPPGIAGVEPIFRMFRTGFPDVKFTIDQMIGEGNYVATLVHGEGTHTGQFIAFPPSGKHAVWRSVGFFRIQDGKIPEHWGIPDLLGLLIQIGVIPPPQAASAAGTVEAQV